MIAEMLQKSKFLLCFMLYYIKFYFDDILHIYVICFIIIYLYLLYIYMYIYVF